jgi:hypothetical protein
MAGHLVKYFAGGRHVRQPQYKQPEASNRTNRAEQHRNERACLGPEARFSRPASRAEWKATSVLDSTNNKLQELVQLLYLLSRDPAVPSDARYHVTVAQSEIALLARLMQNTAEAEADKSKS